MSSPEGKAQSDLGAKDAEKSKDSIKEYYLMDQNEFVKGKRLIDPVTGRVEGDIRRLIGKFGNGEPLKQETKDSWL